MTRTKCETMRRLVLTAVTLLMLGILVLFISKGAALVLPSVISLTISYLGLTLLLSSPLVMFSAFILSLLPGTHHKFEHCNH